MSAQSTKQSPLSGLFVINKPVGLSSRQAAVKLVKQLPGRVKFGHVGTLDPMASGVLPVLVGHATKCMDYLHAPEKEYEFTLRLGQATTTLDAEGDVTTEKEVPPLTSQEIEEAFTSFLGKITQIPPLYSAVKVGGTPLYKMARRQTAEGIDWQSLQRQVEVFELALIKWDPSAQEITARVRCGKGTYVRTLASDIANKMGTVGHLVMLTRTRASGFTLDQALDVSNLPENAAQSMVPIASFPFAFPSWKTADSLVKRLIQGQKVIERKNLFNQSLRGHNGPDGVSSQNVLLLNEKSSAIGIGRFKFLDTQTVEIHMQRGLS